MFAWLFRNVWSAITLPLRKSLLSRDGSGTATSMLSIVAPVFGDAWPSRGRSSIGS